jgi:hypothetical protein
MHTTADGIRDILDRDGSTLPLPTEGGAFDAPTPPPPPAVVVPPVAPAPLPAPRRRWSVDPLALALSLVLMLAVVLAMVVLSRGPEQAPAPVRPAPSTTTTAVPDAYVPAPLDDSPAEARRVQLEQLAEAFIRAYQQPGTPAERYARLLPLSDENVAAAGARGDYGVLAGRLCCAPVIAPTARNDYYAMTLTRLNDGTAVKVQMKTDAAGRWFVFMFQ